MTPRFVLESARLAGSPLLKGQSDERLVDLVRAGNDRAFEAIVERYRRPLLRYCARLLPLGRAEDAVQQAFLNAYAAMRDSDAELDLRPWLYRIARNACLNALRENGWSHEQIENVRRGAESAHDAVERRQELRAVVAAVQVLPDRQREAVVLRELEGCSYDEIASQLDASDGAVRQLLNRARNTLRAGVTALTPPFLTNRLWSPATRRAVRDTAEAAGPAFAPAVAQVAGAVTVAAALVGGLSQAPRLFNDHSAAVGAAPVEQPVRTGPAFLAATPGQTVFTQGWTVGSAAPIRVSVGVIAGAPRAASTLPANPRGGEDHPGRSLAGSAHPSNLSMPAVLAGSGKQTPSVGLDQSTNSGIGGVVGPLGRGAGEAVQGAQELLSGALPPEPSRPQTDTGEGVSEAVERTVAAVTRTVSSAVSRQAAGTGPRPADPAPQPNPADPAGSVDSPSPSETTTPAEGNHSTTRDDRGTGDQGGDGGDGGNHVPSVQDRVDGESRDDREQPDRDGD